MFRKPFNRSLERTVSPPAELLVRSHETPMIAPPFQLHRGIRKFRNPVEGRCYQYSRPETILVLCRRCGKAVPFRTDPMPTHELDEKSGGYLILRGEICGVISGRGACSECGHVARKVAWPEAAYLQVSVPEGVVWAWNRDCLLALRARVSGDKVTLRRHVMQDWNLARYISRLPKFAVLRKNRERIFSGLARLAPELQ
jgi:hypothetical protein